MEQELVEEEDTREKLIWGGYFTKRGYQTYHSRVTAVAEFNAVVAQTLLFECSTVQEYAALQIVEVLNQFDLIFEHTSGN